ncbi:MAG: tRNA 5-methoxyuridine(34)/uridine 5-oxyacetic acid(34) synthase CmoB [Methylococcales bacterium]|nr:tRNA 5-methoxyuridine(34)/uridine 5-oxyacetic acid(34) synthase CmoB [Methylococcales bacterium]
MDDYQFVYALLEATGNTQWRAQLPQQIAEAFCFNRHGASAKWQSIIETLDFSIPSRCFLNQNQVQIGVKEDLNTEQRQALKTQLMTFHPWRKGPFSLFGLHIDSEWRSDWKWQRLENQISPLKNRLVLDVGCGNGYHCWRMLGAGAKTVIGIDPTLINVMQFHFIKKLCGHVPIYVLPITLEMLPAETRLFDTVFSMGVLYHRRSPIDHLFALKDTLRSGGELILETLIIEGQLGESLMPEGRYAKMRNVWFLPSCKTLMGWMKRCGFQNIRLIDVTQTSIEEQRSTEWMTFFSLKNFLDPSNKDLTCEGLPAPKRAIFLANCP